MTSSGASLTESARNWTSGCVASTSRDHPRPPPAGMCTSTSTTSGTRSRIISIAASTSAACADHVELVAELGAHAREEQLMVVDEEDPGQCSCAPPPSSAAATSRPPFPRRGRSGPRRCPPARARRSTIEPAIPRAVGGDGRGIEPAPAVADEDRHPVGLDLEVHATTAPRPSGVPRSDRLARRRAAAVACRRPGSRARGPPRPEHRARSRSRPRSPRGRRRATSPAVVRVRNVAVEQPARSSRSCMRARRTTSRGSSARRCTSARVCSTESCRCAATSARSSDRMRSRRSEMSWFSSCHRPGPSTSANPTSTTAAPITPPRSALHESMLTKNAPSPDDDARDARDDPRERAAPRPDEHRDRVGGLGRESFEEGPVGELGREIAATRRQHREADHRGAERPNDHVAGPGARPRPSSKRPRTTLERRPWSRVRRARRPRVLRL